MTEIKDIISSYTPEEQQQCIQFLNKRNKRHDTKNVKLFKLLINDEMSLNDISIALYKTINKPAVYALRKRLFRALIDFTANTALEDEHSIELKVSKYLLASRRFLKSHHYKTAFKILEKAENLAYDYHLYALLNEIYHTQIEYAYKSSSLDFHELIDKFRTNKTLYKIEDELNIAFSKLKLILKDTKKSQHVINFEDLIEKTFQDLGISLESVLTFKSIYQLISIVNISAFIKKDYYRIDSFLHSAYQKASLHKSKDRQLYYHIHILYMMANTSFRNKKFDESLSYLNTMNTLMNTKQKKYLKQFHLKHQLLLGLNLNYQNQQQQAIDIFEKSLKSKYEDHSTHFDTLLSLMMCYFQARAFKKAATVLSKLKHSDNWYIKHNGYEWTIKKSIVEILLNLELGHLHLFDSRLMSFKRKFYAYLKEIGQKRVTTFMQLIEDYYKDPTYVHSTLFHDKVEKSFDWQEYEDIFVMSFYAWLKSKMEKRDLYEVTLELINAQNK